MISFEVRHAVRVIAAIAVFAVCAAARNGVAAGLDLGTERHRQLLERIQVALSASGPYSSDLLEPLVGLVELYREGGDDALAAVAIQRAVQVVRINNGLHTLEQVPLIRQLIRIEDERGNPAAAWDIEQDLLRLVRRYPDDPRTVPVLREVADRRMMVLGQYLDGERPAEIVLGCYYEAWPQREDANCKAGSRKTVVQGLLAEAQGNYAAAIAVLLRNGLYDSDELRDLELALLRGVDLVRTTYDEDPRRDDLPLVPGLVGTASWEPWRSRTEPIAELASWRLPSPSSESDDPVGMERAAAFPYIRNTYHRGRQSLRRLYAYGVATRSPPLQQATAAVELADWELLYSRHGIAVEAYQLAHDVLARTGVGRASIEELFAPRLPVVLPAFQPNPLARDETRDATGHIDVAFTITKYGRGREIDIVREANATGAARDRIVSLILNSRFRPRPTTGRFDGASRVAVRYYVYETS